MDPTVGAVTIAGLAKLGPSAGRLLERVAGPAADELGEWCRDKVRSFRTRNTQAVVNRAGEMVAARDVQEVPLSILLPLLEAASLQEDLQMREYWAALLANAVVGIASPAYTRILESLGPLEARVLTVCGEIDHAARAGAGSILTRGGYVASRASIAERAEIATAVQLEIALDTLISVRLLDPDPAVYPLEPNFAEDGSLGLRLTSLGRSFLQAVTPPQVQQS